MAARYKQVYMKKTLYLLILLFSVKYSYTQNVNMILEVNGKVLNGEISNLYIKYGEEQHFINYYPGDLILSDIVWSKIQAETQKKFFLHFDYSTYNKDNHQIENFDIELNKELLKQPFLIVNVYDFRDEKYKKWYQYLTKENYLVEITYPNCELYIRRE